MFRQRSWWIVALLLVALLGATVVAWRWLRDDAATLTASGNRRAPTGSPTQALPDAAEAAPRAAALREADDASGDDKNPVRELAVDAAVKHGIALTVVRHDDGVPVAGAEVVVLDSRKVAREEVVALARDPAELRRGASWLLRTDATGLTHVPRPVVSYWIVCCADGRRGSLSVHAATFEAQRLELFQPRGLVVRVVDEQAAPQPGIDVAFAAADASFIDAPLRAMTDGDGLARLVDLELDPQMQVATRKMAVGLALPLQPPVRLAVALDPPPTEPLVLTLPATGALVFQVVDRDGEPVASAGTIELAAAAADGSDPRDRRLRGDQLALQAKLDAQGRATLARVGLRLVFHATPQLPERPPDRTSSPKRFAGPSHAGESIDVALAVETAGPILTGRVVASGDAPSDAGLAGVDLAAQLDAFEASGKLAGTDRSNAIVAADGAFRFDFSRGSLKERECQLFLRATRAGQPVAEAQTTATLPAKGSVDLGTIRMALPPLLATGSVVDDEGAPIEAAQIRVDVDPDRPIPFKVRHLPRAFSVEDGTFELRGEAPAGDLSLTATRTGYLAMKPVAFAAGARDVTLTLRMGAMAAGSVVLPDGFPRELLSVRLQLPGSWPPAQEVVPVRPDGLFRFPVVAAGLWNFELLLGRESDNAETLTTVHQVALHAAELTRDPRLQQIDLLAYVRVIEANVRVAGGDLAAKGAVGRPMSTPKAKSTLSVPLQDGRALVPCVSVPVDLEVVVPGFLAQTVRGVEGPVDVLMRRGLPVHYVVSGRLEKQPDWIPVRVIARPKDEAIAAVSPGEPVALTNGEASQLLPAAGRYRARIEFVPPPDPNATATDARRRGRMRSEVEFEVKEVDREQVVELKVKG